MAQETEAPGASAGQSRRTAWLSEGLESLIHERSKVPQRDSREVDFDVVIVGSGYGGSIAASELAGYTFPKNGKSTKISVCVLERGLEHLPGAFPATVDEFPGHVRFSNQGTSFARGNLEGLFDFRLSADMSALVANGLGGGSLINAGVLEKPQATVFDRPCWPKDLMGSFKVTLDETYDSVRNRLAAAPMSNDAAHTTLPKTHALRGLNPSRFAHPHIQIAQTSGVNPAGVSVNECTKCGDCATGCNFGAKISHDTNLLKLASERGASIFTGATVLRIDRSGDDDHWILDVVHTAEHLRKRQIQPFELRCRYLILAAGTFGSTELLLRSRTEYLRFSEHLGRHISGNGDAIVTAYGMEMPANNMANPEVAPEARGVGPTIAGMIDGRGEGGDGFVYQDISIPASFHRFTSELIATSKFLYDMPRIPDPADRDHHLEDFYGAKKDPLMLDPRAYEKVLMIAVFGDDGAKGRIAIPKAYSADVFAEGSACIRWPGLSETGLYDRQLSAFDEMLKRANLNATMLTNPVWRLLPQGLRQLVKKFPDGPALTVHPLGGCRMGDSHESGVVDSFGRVFQAPDFNPNESLRRVNSLHFPGLVVLDGSIVPTALGINPALTIAVLAHRAVSQLRDEFWFKGASRLPIAVNRCSRPIFRKSPWTPPGRPTEVRLRERMSGAVDIDGERYALELTLCFEPKALRPMFEMSADFSVAEHRRLRLNSEQSYLRLFRWDDWHALTHPEYHLADLKGGEAVKTAFAEQFKKLSTNPAADLPKCAPAENELDQVAAGRALAWAKLNGNLDLFAHETRSFSQRWRAAVRASLKNRFIRDAVQSLINMLRYRRSVAFSWSALLDGSLLRRIAAYVKLLIAIGSRAGEIRLWSYDLKWDQARLAASCDGPARDALSKVFVGDAANNRIAGVKRLTYGWLSSPLEQSVSLELTSYPGHTRQATPAILKVDPLFLVRAKVPLLEITQQQNLVQAYQDFLSFGLYFVRLLVSTHLLALRLPDPKRASEPRRLPGTLPTLRRFPIVGPIVHPQFAEFSFAKTPQGKPVAARLTRYERAGAKPVLLMHGYSASGTTFAHPALKPGLADFLWKQGRDVWIADFRTSAGMPTASDPWRFEDVAFEDVPVLVQHVREQTGGAPIDVFAHCMGAAMLSMAIIQPPTVGDAYLEERATLPESLNNVVLSQIAPLLAFDPMLRLRGYVLTYLRNFLPLDDYQFRARPNVSLVDHLLDRLLCLGVSAPGDLAIENAIWPPWENRTYVSGRHRLDLLYGRTFTLRNMDKRVLRDFDDFFGPLSIETYAQAGRFSRKGQLADVFGETSTIQSDPEMSRWRRIGGHTTCIHAAQNGLASPLTLATMAVNFQERWGIARFTPVLVEGAGHQDCLIGKTRMATFDHVLSGISRQ